MIQGQINLHTHPGMKIREISKLAGVYTKERSKYFHK